MGFVNTSTRRRPLRRLGGACNPGLVKKVPELIKIDNDGNGVFKLPSSDSPGGMTNLLLSSKVLSLVSPVLGTMFN